MEIRGSEDVRKFLRDPYKAADSILRSTGDPRGPRVLGLELKFDQIKGLGLGVTGILAEGCMFLFCVSCAKGLVLRVWHSSCQ